MHISDLDYHLPEGLIAQRPAEPRDSSRLMVVDIPNGAIEHRSFRDLPQYLRSGDVITLNETKVIPARLEAEKPTGGKVELLFLRAREDGWEALARPSRRLHPGMQLSVGDERVEMVRDLGDGRWVVSASDVMSLLDRNGHMPLPPYIHPTQDSERAYQTVYARNPGSAAAPTAGFHFTGSMLDSVEAAGAEVARVTLHVGTGTFLPLRTELVEEHVMHKEWYSVPDETVRALERAKRVLAVGTTTARTLESRAASGINEGETDIFIYPGYQWKAVDSLLTNFHLPRSTLLAMVMSFAGVDLVREAYQIAVRDRYRFYSFGDAMLLLNGGKSK